MNLMICEKEQAFNYLFNYNVLMTNPMDFDDIINVANQPLQDYFDYRINKRLSKEEQVHISNLIHEYTLRLSYICREIGLAQAKTSEQYTEILADTYEQIIDALAKESYNLSKELEPLFRRLNQS